MLSKKHFSITTFSIGAGDAKPCDAKGTIATQGNANGQNAMPSNNHYLNLPGMKSTSFINQLCAQTGISKRSLASLTGAHQSMIVRYSAGTHSLPASAFEPLLRLQQQVLNTKAPAPPQPSATDIAELQEQARWCLARCYPLQKKLAAMQLAYTQGATAIQLLDAHYSGDTIDPKLQRWIAQQRYEANKKMEQNNWAAQFKLSTAIALLQQEAELCTAVENGYTDKLEKEVR